MPGSRQVEKLKSYSPGRCQLLPAVSGRVDGTGCHARGTTNHRRRDKPVRFGGNPSTNNRSIQVKWNGQKRSSTQPRRSMWQIRRRGYHCQVGVFSECLDPSRIADEFTSLECYVKNCRELTFTATRAIELGGRRPGEPISSRPRRIWILRRAA